MLCMDDYGWEDGSSICPLIGIETLTMKCSCEANDWKPTFLFYRMSFKGGFNSFEQLHHSNSNSNSTSNGSNDMV